MSKIDSHIQDLEAPMLALIKEGQDESLIDYLVANSNLPGRRGNLELAQAFAASVKVYAPEHSPALWAQCIAMTGISAAAAPVNDPREFIPFCGTVGLGVLGAQDGAKFEAATAKLRELANDQRWRMREAVCMGLQSLLHTDSVTLLEALLNWVKPENWLEMRAAAATTADPPALKADPELTRTALVLHENIIAQLRGVTKREHKTDAFKALRKGLGYTLSVVVQAIPQAGFATMESLARTEHSDVRWIVKENLKKKRLTRNYPERVTAVQAALDAAA